MSKLITAILLLTLSGWLALYFMLSDFPLQATFENQSRDIDSSIETQYKKSGSNNVEISSSNQDGYIASGGTIPRYAMPNNIVPEKKYRQKETILLNFIKRCLLQNDGGILSNLKPGEQSTDILSESVGLLMNYCTLRNEKELFDKEYAFLKKSLLNDNQYVRWQNSNRKVTCNALIDDFRIIRALLDADSIWDNYAYYSTAVFIWDSILKKQSPEGKLREFYDWQADKSSVRLPLCYIDLYTLYKLTSYNNDWNKALDNSLYILKDGRLSNDCPFYYKYYDHEKNSYLLDEEYAKKDSICLIYTIYTVIHLAELNENTDFFTEWIKNEMQNNILYAWYNPESLKPSSKMESTAVYALAAVYARKVGEDALYRKLTENMLKSMVTDESSPYYGGMGISSTQDFYSFDNLTALWALAIE